MYTTLLFYKYIHLENPHPLIAEHLDFCRSLGIKGRILIGEEGINGSVSGSQEQIDIYTETLRGYPEFSDIEFKIGYAEDHIFQKMHVRYRREICVLGMLDIDPNTERGDYIEPLELYQLLESGEEVIMLDGRNNYEWEVGKFKNAITLDEEYFRDFPEALDELEHLKDKKIVSYCTGGIRCEKFSSLLKRKGFKNVSQLHGGILKYAEMTDGKHYEGKCFMFDDRLVVPVNQVDEDSVISHCTHCEHKSDRMMNCPNIDCNRLYICCETCDEKMDGFCSEACTHATRVRSRRPVKYIDPKVVGKI